MTSFYIESQKESFTMQGCSAEMVVRTEWPSRITVAREWFGRLQSGIYITPGRYPDIEGLFCNNVSIEPWPGSKMDDGTLGWEWAKLTLSFGMMETGTGGDIADEKITIGGQTITLPCRKYQWAEGPLSGQLLDENTDAKPFAIVPEMTYSLSYHFQTNIDRSLYASLVGNINSSTFTPTVYDGTASWEARSVIYMGCETDRKITSDGANYWKITHNFGIQTDHTWQQFYCVTDGNFHKITDLDSDPVFPESDLNALIGM